MKKLPHTHFEDTWIVLTTNPIKQIFLSLRDENHMAEN